MTLAEAINRLSEGGIENARGEAREIFAHFGAPRALLADTRFVCDDPGIEDAIVRRLGREPLQYIIGEVEFCHERYRVSPDCLIPRADTEILVEYAASHLKEGDLFADLCTGSGCVAISTLKATRGTRALAVDISEGALKIAKENAKTNGVPERIAFLQKDLLTGSIEGEFDAILSNPPYIPTEVYLSLEKEIFHEPRIAFEGGEDGSLFYRRLIPLSLSVLKENGFIAMEIGFDQAALLGELAEENCCEIEIIKDYCDRDRVAVLRRKKTNAC